MRLHRCLFGCERLALVAFLVCILDIAGTRLKSTSRSAPSIDWSRYVPTQIAGLGRYNSAPALFLEREPGGHVLAIPISRDGELAVEEIIRDERPTQWDARSGVKSVTNRDGGIFDNLPWEWNPSVLAKRDAVISLSSLAPRKDLSKEEEKAKLVAELSLKKLSQDFGMDSEESTLIAEERAKLGVEIALRELFLQDFDTEVSGSSYSLVLDTIRRYACAEPSTVLIEDASIFDDSLVLGGCLLLERKGRSETTLCECYPDEAIGVASALGANIMVENEVWEAASLPPKYSIQKDRLRLNVVVPERVVDTASADKKTIPLPWEIRSVNEFEKMSLQEKARSALSAGIKLPRPRDAANESMNALLAPYLDESIRRQLQVRRAVDAEDYEQAIALERSSSRRYELMKTLRRAIAAEQYEKVCELALELEIETSRRLDVTQDEGSYSTDLDQDDWYAKQLAEERRREQQR